MSTLVRNNIIEELAGTLDIPETAYDAADRRYKDVAAWFCRQESKCAQHDPHIYPQGSFRLGTVVRPLILTQIVTSFIGGAMHPESYEVSKKELLEFLKKCRKAVEQKPKLVKMAISHASLINPIARGKMS